MEMYVEKNGNKSPNVTCCIDWISFTLFGLQVNEVLDLFGFTQYDLEQKYGARGYKAQYCISEVGFAFMFDGDSHMGIHVDIPSKALDLFLGRFKVSKYAIHTPFEDSRIAYDEDLCIVNEVIKIVKRYGHFTRFDIAVDDLEGYYTVSEVYDLLNREMYISSFRKYDYYVSKNVTGGRNGETVYMGSRQSNFFLRVYDKQLEQGVDFSWIRWELEIKHECADILAEHLLNNPICEVIFGTLNNFVRFINDDNARKCRCSTSDKWLEFLGAVKEMPYHIKHYVTTFEDKEEWIERQVMPTICALMLANGGSMDFIEERLLESAYRLTDDMKKRLSQVNPNWEQLLYYLE